MLDLEQLSNDIKTEALNLGFNHIGIAPVHPVPHIQTFLDWVTVGNHADMDYLAREDTLAKRSEPQLILEGCQRIICLALPYQRPQTKMEALPAGKGRVSTYAVTRDYHLIIWDKLAQLETFIQSRTGEKARLKSYVDTGPILERSYASLAGLGSAGKNSCLLIQGSGSYFFLTEILTDLELPIDEPYQRDLCGSCRRCIDACPTGCILENRTIDSRRCISYLTIENKGIIPDPLKTKVEDWVFGCDICQIVCPHNTSTPAHPLDLDPRLLPEALTLLDLFSYNDEIFSEHFSQTPVSRAKRSGLLRNAAVVLGNQKLKAALPVLNATLSNEDNLAVQDACQWAINQIEGTA